MGRKTLAIGLLLVPFMSGMVMAFGDDFVGHWQNQNKNTRAITSAEIEDLGGEVKVHMWGACHPNPCDWGESTLEGHGKVRHARWTTGFATKEQTLKLLKEHRLRVKTHTHFTDNSGRRDYTATDILLQQP